MSADSLRGRFVVLEGIDGSGSTTQSRKLVEYLNELGKPALWTCEPSSGPVGTLIRSALSHSLASDGELIRLDWVSLALLFAADRADHVSRVVEPALAKGHTVVSDRYDLSSLAYQSATSGQGADVLEWIRQLNARVLRPDLTLVIDVSAQTAARRRHSRGGSAELFEIPELQRRLAEIYRGAEALVPMDRVGHIDGEPASDVVFDQVKSAVEALDLVGFG